MRIATTIADFHCYPLTSAETVRCYEGTGFRHLDYSFYRATRPGGELVADDWMRYVIDAGKEAERLGFDFVQAHSPSNNFMKETEEFDHVVALNVRAIEACGYLGIPNIVVHSGYSDNSRYPADMADFHAQNRRFYEAMLDAAEKNNVTVCTENFCTTREDGTCAFLTAQDIMDFLNYCGDPQYLAACWDTGHGNLQGIDVYEQLMTLGGSLKTIHVQDNMGKRDDHIAPFTGTLDLDGLMCGLIDSGFVDRGGVFTFEAGNIIQSGHSWPNYRHLNDSRPQKLASPSPELKRKAIALLYEMGCEMLRAYDIPIE